jgi:hypothetical protein
MVDSPKANRPPTHPWGSEGPSAPMAGAGEIPRPSAENAKKQEAAAQMQKMTKTEVSKLPQSLKDVIATMKKLEREGKRVERNTRALMDFLKHGDGSEVSAEVLTATATLMASMTKKNPEKKKRIKDLYFRWARQTTTALITRVINTFKPKE